MQKSIAVPIGLLACLAFPAVASAADRDHDRLPDRWEHRYHLSTHHRSASQDPDHDGVTNLREYRHRLNPRRKDTDGDGASDGRELRAGTNARSARSYPLRRHRKPATSPISSPAPAPAPTPSPTPTPSPVPPSSGVASYAACSQTVSSAAAAVSAVSAASPGAVVCLADGSYGSMSFSAKKTGQVVVQAQHPGAVTLGGVVVTGSYLKFAGFVWKGSDIQLQPPANHIVIENNSFTGGGFAVDMASSDAYISDVTIRGNRMVGPFGEDALRVNRYHDGDGDGVGLLVEGNEFTNVVQQGGSSAPHADLLQSVWGGDHIVFRRNYAHDNRAENFFIKDQPGTVDGVDFEDNLMVRNGVASAGAGQPSIVNLYGPTTGMVIRRNTIWDTQGSSPLAWQGSGWGSIAMDHNVLYRVWGSGSGGSWSLSDNTYCDWTGTMPTPGTSSTKQCSPTFVAPSADDYRIAGSDRGIDWAPANQHYGP